MRRIFWMTRSPVCAIFQIDADNAFCQLGIAGLFELFSAILILLEVANLIFVNVAFLLEGISQTNFQAIGRNINYCTFDAACIADAGAENPQSDQSSSLVSSHAPGHAQSYAWTYVFINSH